MVAEIIKESQDKTCKQSNKNVEKELRLQCLREATHTAIRMSDKLSTVNVSDYIIDQAERFYDFVVNEVSKKDK